MLLALQGKTQYSQERLSVTVVSVYSVKQPRSPLINL